MAGNASDIDIAGRCFLYNHADEGASWGHCCDELSIVPKPWWLVFIISLPIEAVLAGVDVRATKAMYEKKKDHTALIFVVYNLLSLGLLSYEYFQSNRCDTSSFDGVFECYQGLIFMFYNSTAALATLTLWMLIIMRKFYIYLYDATRTVIFWDKLWRPYDASLSPNYSARWKAISKETGLYWYNKLLIGITLIFGGLTHVLPLFFVYPYIMFSLVFAMIYSHSNRLAYIYMQNEAEKAKPPNKSRKNLKSVFLNVFVFYPFSLLVVFFSIPAFLIKYIARSISFTMTYLLMAVGHVVTSCSTKSKRAKEEIDEKMEKVADVPVEFASFGAARSDANILDDESDMELPSEEEDEFVEAEGMLEPEPSLSEPPSAGSAGPRPGGAGPPPPPQSQLFGRKSPSTAAAPMQAPSSKRNRYAKAKPTQVDEEIDDGERTYGEAGEKEKEQEPAGEVEIEMEVEVEKKKAKLDERKQEEVRLGGKPEVKKIEAKPDKPKKKKKKKKARKAVINYIKDILKNLCMYDPDGRLIMLAASTTFLCFTLSANYGLLLYSNAPYERVPIIDSNARSTSLYVECTRSNLESWNAFGLVDFLGLALTGVGAIISFGEFIVTL